MIVEANQTDSPCYSVTLTRTCYYIPRNDKEKKGHDHQHRSCARLTKDSSHPYPDISKSQQKKCGFRSKIAHRS